jgi:hypothetical protein
MAINTIVQRIALEGGEAIKDQLKALGDAGEKAFKQIQAAALKADFSKFSASLSKVGSDLETVVKRTALLGSALAVAAGGAGAALVAMAKSGADAADEAGKAAQKTGLQVEAFGKLAFAASQADLSQEQFVSGMSRLNKAIAEAAAKGKAAAGVLGDANSSIVHGAGFTTQTFDALGVSVTRFGAKAKDAAKAAKPVADVFTKLGVNIKDANGKLKTNEQILLEVSDAFKRMPDGAEKSALAIELFGKAGAEMLPFLNAGKQGLIDLGDEAVRTGIVFTKAQADIAENFNDTLSALGKAIRGTRIQLGLLFAPIFTALAAGLRDEINNNREAIVAFGQKVAQVTAGVLGDLLHILSGNPQNVKNPWIRDWSEAIIQFGRDFFAVVQNVVLPLFKVIHDGAQLVADAINNIFGTNISGGQLLIGAALLQLLGVFRVVLSTAGAVVAAFQLIGAVISTAFGGAAIASITGFFGALITGALDFIGLIAVLIGWPALLVAAVVAAGVAIAVFWDDVVAGATIAWQAIVTGATAAWDAIVAGATSLWDGIVQAFNSGQQAAVDAFNGIVDAVVSAWNGLVDRLAAIAQQIVDRIAGWFGTLPQRISAIFDSVVSTVSSVLARVSSLVDSIISKIQSAIDFAKQLTGLGGGDSGGGGTQGFASGGFARGPGGPKGDKIPAWLSDGEAITQTSAVNYYGRGLFHALNKMAIPRDLLKERLRGFNLGGFVDGLSRSMIVPRFADGGFADKALAPASSGLPNMTSFDLIIDGRSFGPAYIPGTAAMELQTASLRGARVSAGRAPRRK